MLDERRAGEVPKAILLYPLVAEGLALELELTQHVEHLAPECLAGLVQLLQQRPVHVALPGLLGEEVPQVVWPMRWMRPNRCSMRLGFHGRS